MGPKGDGILFSATSKDGADERASTTLVEVGESSRTDVRPFPLISISHDSRLDKIHPPVIDYVVKKICHKSLDCRYRGFLERREL